MTAPAALRNRLRRYPALGFLAVAALLASLLPSALRVPLSGPTTSAELAPVPGKSDSASGDLSALGESSTGGLGSGGGLGGLGGGGRNGEGTRHLHDGGSGGGAPDDGSGRNPANKRCVGKPPRQTEDPLSPACVAYFKGDNFGATNRGVTRDEIRVVYHQGTDSDGSYTVYDLDKDDSPFYYESLKAYARYFNERFQTYGRRVHIYAVEPAGTRSACGSCGSAATVRSVVQRIAAEIDPFYIITYDGRPEGAEEAARLGIMTSLGLYAPLRAFTRAHAPYVVSYGPDLEHVAETAVESVCARLAGRPARFHGDPAKRETRRKFGLVYRNSSDPDHRGADLIVDGLRRRCPQAGEVAIGCLGDACLPDDAEGMAETTARLALAGVTTVLNACCGMGHAAPEAEWLMIAQHVVLSSSQGPSEAASRSFGLIEERRLGRQSEMDFRRAALEGGCDCGDRDISEYNAFMLLFTGVQAAGPRLTAANLDKGMRALPARQSRNPFAPSAYFGPGDHFFVKDYMFAWWDPAAYVPDSNSQGCWRLVEDGLRYRPEDWARGPQGDDGIQQRTPEQPCQGKPGALS